MSDLQSRVQSYDSTMVDRHKVERLEAKVREVESKLELEVTTRQRMEVRGCLPLNPKGVKGGEG